MNTTLMSRKKVKIKEPNQAQADSDPSQNHWPKVVNQVSKIHVKIRLVKIRLSNQNPKQFLNLALHSININKCKQDKF